MSHQHRTIGDTVYFWFASNDTSGSGDDGASAAFDVREAGAAAGAAPLLSGSPTLLSHANYPAGCYEVAVAATVGNGFAAGDTFAVFCTLAVDSQNPTGFVGSCNLGAIPAAVTSWNGVALSTTNPLPNAAPDGAGGLPVSDAGGLDLDTLIGRLDAAITSRAAPGAEMDLVNAPNATAVTAIQNGLATLQRLLAYVQLLARSDAGVETDLSTELGEINNDEGSGAGNFSAQTDSVEAIRDRGDAAYLTATGFSTHSAADVRTEMDSNSTQFSQILTVMGTPADTDISTDIANAAADQQVTDGVVDNLNLGIIYGQAQTGTLTVQAFTTNLSGYADDQLIGRVVIFTSGACEGEGARILDYANASGLVTVSTGSSDLTTAPSNGDTFKIV